MRELFPSVLNLIARNFFCRVLPWLLVLSLLVLRLLVIEKF